MYDQNQNNCNTHEQVFFLITGMHRSGTSFIARAFNLAGVYLGEYKDLISDEWRHTNENLRGHWENRELLELTEQTLLESDGTWHNIPEKLDVSENIGNQIQKVVNKLQLNSLITAGFKDPRIIFCMESWRTYLPNKLFIVGIFRHPLKVAESLKNRNNFSYEKSISLWYRYNTQLLELFKKYDGILLNFDWPKEKILSELKLSFKNLHLSESIDLNQWFTEDLLRSNQTYDASYKIDSKTTDLYKKLQERSMINSQIQFPNLVEGKSLEKIIENYSRNFQRNEEYFRSLNSQKQKEIDQLNAAIIEKQKEIIELTKDISDLSRRISQIDTTQIS
ncbi:MAG: hypothetical protein OEM28_06855 [Nitrosopumilus sp.]|nr:hypothetical protein [Nitrosopumilus sp.]MDH3488185.1 hypothetical protein [Nitrosopumilus sp.]